jgi:hypothetical protein
MLIATLIESRYNPGMARIEERSGNLWTRFNDWYERWAKRTFPDWLYKELTFHPQRASRPKKPGSDRLYSLFLIAVAAIVLTYLIIT